MTVVSKPMDNKPAIGSILMRGILAAVVAAAINALLFVIGGALGGFPDDALVPMTGQPLQLIAFVILSIAGGIAATIGYIVLTRRLSMGLSKAILWVVGILVLVGMYFGPGVIENLPMVGFIVLQIAHVVAGILPLVNLTR